MSEMIKYGGQSIDDDDILAVSKVLGSDFLSQGPQIEEFEKKLSEITGARYCVVVANGTAALHLAVMSLKLSEGKGGITSANTFFASANALLYNRLKPDFSDIDREIHCMSPCSLKERMGGDTGVIIPVHFAGHPAEMKEIAEIAAKNGSFVIEDAAHALGSRFEDGTPVGSCCHSHMTVFSFQPLKTITTGEGGAVTTNDVTFYNRLRQLRNHGITKDPSAFVLKDSGENRPWYHEIQELGFNYRMTDFQAALGISQLGKMNRFIEKRLLIAGWYREGLRNLDWLSLPVVKPGVHSAHHLFPVEIDFEILGESRTDVMGHLAEKRIQTQVHYIPVHLQPLYRDRYGFSEGDFPNAEYYYSRCLSLPLHVGLDKSDVLRVMDAVMGLKS